MAGYGRLPDPYASLRKGTPRTGPSVPNMGGIAPPVASGVRPFIAPMSPATGRPGPAPAPGAVLPNNPLAAPGDPLAAAVTAGLGAGRPAPTRKPAAPAGPVGAAPLAVPDPTYQADLRGALERFGRYPGMEDPNHPPPPIVPGGLSFNPFASKGAEWTR